ncbi:hypothetical protein FNF28_04776 [Cafeteria roenbergensis]|uniref:Saposin B-type domain-containing protein n=2 Tax=Cafeteria roenbergensis TaxID=33653 RepID=A0A5A8DE78_CAFRO|nr:hypothetical protein FNF28_04776 [Cafeteria roenbergensis]
MARASWRAALVGLAVAALSLGPAAGQNMRESILPMMRCTACERVIGKAAPFVNRLVLKERIWSKELAREIMDHVSSHSCSDDELFGSNSGELLQGCLSFMTDSFPRIREGLRRHLHPRYEEFGEDVSATEFCVDIGVCSQGLGHSLDRSLQRSQLLEEHRKRMQDL